LREELDPTLSEIDVAIVTDCGEIEKILRFKAEIAGRCGVHQHNPRISSSNNGPALIWPKRSERRG